MARRERRWMWLGLGKQIRGADFLFFVHRSIFHPTSASEQTQNTPFKIGVYSSKFNLRRWSDRLTQIGFRRQPHVPGPPGFEVHCLSAWNPELET